MPCSIAALPTTSPATCAAYGVDLRDPLKPCAPADDQAIVIALASVMVMMVLLNVELTCAVPAAIFFRSRRRVRARCSCFGHDISPLSFLLAGNRLGRALAGPGVGVRALTTHRQLTAVTQTTIATKIHQTLDVHGRVAAKFTLNRDILGR